MKSNKPVAFNYRDYIEAKEEIERLKGVNSALQNQVIQDRIEIADLKAQLEANKGETVTRTIERVASEMCKQCVHQEECYELLEIGENGRPCPMDWLM